MSDKLLYSQNLVVEELGCQRGGLEIFSGLSLVLGPGQIARVEGPNGSGKTSFLRMVAGLLDIAEGKIETNPLCVHYLGHLPALKPLWTVFESLDSWVKIMGEKASPDHIQQALKHFSLTPLQDIPIAFLSEGQKRRVALARLMVMDRPVWLLDEPNAGLDKKHQKALDNLIVSHQQKGGIAVIASHVPFSFDVDVILTMSDYRKNDKAA